MAFSEGMNSGTSNGTTDVTVVDSPAVNTTRIVKSITIHNTDTATAVVTLMLNNGTNQRNILVVSLSTGDNLLVDDVLVIPNDSSLIEMKLSGTVTTNELQFTAHYGDVT